MCRTRPSAPPWRSAPLCSREGEIAPRSSTEWTRTPPPRTSEATAAGRVAWRRGCPSAGKSKWGRGSSSGRAPSAGSRTACRPRRCSSYQGGCQCITRARAAAASVDAAHTFRSRTARSLSSHSLSSTEPRRADSAASVAARHACFESFEEWTPARRAPRAALSPSLNFFKLRRVRALSSLPRGSSVFSSPRGRLARVAGDSGRRRLLRQHRRVRSLTAYASRCSVGPTSALPPPSCRAEQGAVSSSQETVESRRPSQNLVAALDEGGKDGRRRRRGPTLSLSLSSLCLLFARALPHSPPLLRSPIPMSLQTASRRGAGAGERAVHTLPAFFLPSFRSPRARPRRPRSTINSRPPPQRTTPNDAARGSSNSSPTPSPRPRGMLRSSLSRLYSV